MAPSQPDIISTYGRPLPRVAREIDKHLATLHRWRVAGVLDGAGVRRRLAMTRVGGRWYVRDADLVGFFRALAVAPDAARSDPADALRSAERAARELDALGI